MRGKVFVGLLVLAGCSCRGGQRSEQRPPIEPGPALAASAPVVMDAAVEVPQATLDQGMPRLAVVLDDPRLASVREQEQAHNWLDAAQALQSVRASTTLDVEQACAWTYLQGRLFQSAGETVDAVAAFDRVAGFGEGASAPCPLASYAALHAAQGFVRLARYDEAVVRAESVPPDVAAHDDAQLVLADAYNGKGERAAALPIWRARLASSPHGPRWAEIALDVALALRDGLEGPPESHAREGFDLVSRVLVESPAFGEKVDAQALRAHWALLLGHATPSALSLEERAQQAQAWLDAKQPKHAMESAQAILRALPRGAKEHREAGCKAAIVAAQARPRGRADESADAWGVAISRCEGDESLATALYYGAKASVSARRPLEAFERFGKVEKLFPKHRLADDACLRSALLACDEGEESRGIAQLSSLPDTYPDGDMAGEALFRMALLKLEKRDLEGARDALDRLLAAGLDGAKLSAGRAAYFRARVSQLSGDLEDAQRRYTAVIEEQPLAFYMLLAYGRLKAIDESAARAAIEAAVSREPDGPFLTMDHPELASAAMARFVRLLEVGEVESARREAYAGGLVGDAVDPEVVWTVAWLYDRAGVPELGHSFSRARLLDFRDHWPVGRWRLPWQVAFPRVWETLVARDSEASHIPISLTWAIMREESAFNPDARSVADAIGLMQLIGPTARATARGTVLPFDDESLHRPEISIALGTRLLGSLRESFSSNPSLAIAAYNGGAGAVRRWLGERALDDFDVFVERIPYEETRAYLKRVLASQAAYAYLYVPQSLDELLSLPMRATAELVAAP